MTPLKNEIEEFFQRRPQMSKKSQYPGTFRDFAIDITRSITAREKIGPLNQIIIQEAKRIFSTGISLASLENQLLTHPLVSYADHHGLLNYRLLYNSNLLYAEVIKKLSLPFVIVFATGSIPLANKSHPRGFYFKGMRYNFFKNKQRHIPVYLLEEKLQANKGQGIENFVLNYSQEILTREEKRFLDFLFFDCLELEKASKDFETFSDQITFLNYKLWKYYFAGAIRDSLPGLIYLQSNRIILEFLIGEIKKEDSLISLILFHPEVRGVFLKNFYGIDCCWGENMGSQLFWGITAKKRFISLRFEASPDSLVGQDFNIKLERETIIDALKAKRILPTSFFDLLLVTFLEGYLTLGGFNQLEYLQQMQKAHIKSLQEIGMSEMAQQFASRVTDGLICGMFPFAFDSGIDLIWHYNSRDGRFNGNLDGGLTQEDLNRLLNMKIKDMILSAIETMLENM